LNEDILGPRSFWGLKIYFKNVVDLAIEGPNFQFMVKKSLVVEVRPIKGKIDHPTFFKKYGTSAIQTLS
jgi:hypothetical protein